MSDGGGRGQRREEGGGWGLWEWFDAGAGRDGCHAAQAGEQLRGFIGILLRGFAIGGYVDLGHHAGGYGLFGQQSQCGQIDIAAFADLKQKEVGIDVRVLDYGKHGQAHLCSCIDGQSMQCSARIGGQNG